MALGVKTGLGSHFLVGIGEFTTHFRTYVSGYWDVLGGIGEFTTFFLEPILAGIESDVHWGLTGVLTHAQIDGCGKAPHSEEADPKLAVEVMLRRRTERTIGTQV